MLIAVGTRVRLKNTGDEGIVKEVLGNDLFTVYLTELDMEIPAFSSNLERLKNKPTTGQIVKGKQQKPKPEMPKEAIQYQILTKKGLLLAFQPIYNREDSVESFDIHLINDTDSDVIYNFELHLRDRTLLRKSQNIASASIILLGNISFFQLNDTPSVAINCWKVTSNGTGAKLDKEFRIKPKNFFTRSTTAPLLNRTAFVYKLFADLEQAPKNKPTSSEDLNTYTKRKNTSPSRSKKSHYRLHDVTEFAEFSGEIDLHIDQLVANTKKLAKKEILDIQLRHFDEFLAKAIRLGVEKCFAIHGIGKGKLRDEIANRLKRHPQVTDFKNEYHHRYGWGATEIILK